MADQPQIIARLTQAQKDVLQMRFDRPNVHSGRGGFAKSTMEALARLGLAKRGRQFTYELDWRLTELGIQIGRELSAQHRALLAEQDRKT